MSDANAIRALSHPVRAELLEVLAMHESLTATHAGELIGESPTTCSFHLRQLAKYGFVEEAVKGKGRQRPWRLVNRMLTISSEGLEPEASVAADVLTAMIVQRALRRFDQMGAQAPSVRAGSSDLDYIPKLGLSDSQPIL